MPSRSDQLFQKRKAKNRKNLARRGTTLSERKRVLIVCEGEKTEPHYFKFLVGDMELTTVDVEVCGDCGSAPKSVVKFGKERFEKDPDFDLIFFVFDRDSHPDFDDALALIGQFQKLRKLKGKKVFTITSNPCFELWFLLHFKESTKPFVASGSKSSCGNLISEMKKLPCFKNYNKGQSNQFHMLQEQLNVARSRSARILQQSRENGDREHHGNPTTYVHVLIDELEREATESQRRWTNA